MSNFDSRKQTSDSQDKKLNRLRTKYLKTKCLKTKFNIACAYNPIIEVRMEARFIAV